MPPGSWDTHCHVLGPTDKYPFASTTTINPADAPKEKLFALHEMLRIERCVIVQTATHGMDNRVTEDALAAKGGAYLGVALLPTTVSDAELRRLDGRGFRGVRFNFMRHLHQAATLEVMALAPRLANIGWHLQVHMDGALIADMAGTLERSPVPVVIDHIGRVDAGLGLEQAPFAQLLRLMRNDKFWVKVSGCDRISRAGPPYADAVPFARELVMEFPDGWWWWKKKKMEEEEEEEERERERERARPRAWGMAHTSCKAADRSMSKAGCPAAAGVAAFVARGCISRPLL